MVKPCPSLPIHQPSTLNGQWSDDHGRDASDVPGNRLRAAGRGGGYGMFLDQRRPSLLLPLAPGETLETDGFRLETRRALHGVEGSCGRFTDRATGRVVAFSGDTGPNPSLVELAWRADLLIHEASMSPDTPDHKAVVHSRASDAASVAVEAEVACLRLVHLGAGHRQRSLEVARQI